MDELDERLRNGLALLRGERLHPGGKMPSRVVRRDANHELRRYTPEGAETTGAPILLMPALMASADIYDLCPEQSTVRMLTEAGCDTWLLDFGNPEEVPGGMDRSLDDYLLSLDAAIDCVVEQTGQDVHVAGYSQGGMLVYQVAAYREGRGFASMITFGSMVDMYRNFLPQTWPRERITRDHERMGPYLERNRHRLPGMSSSAISSIFRAISARKRIKQQWSLLDHLHDRTYLTQTEPLRRFLGGEGFIAWSGPSLVDWTQEFIIHNRLLRGGFKVGGKVCSMQDVQVPILSVVGKYDALTSYECVRAIREAAPKAPLYEHEIAAGHFGLVVGRSAAAESWPTVLDWMAWQDRRADQPPAIRDRRAPGEP